MGMLKFWTICAVLIFLDHSFSLQCKWTQYKLRKLNEESIQLLTDMGDFPQQCINENVLITFPRSAFASNGSSDSDSVRTAINQTLHSINCLFENNDLPTEWDEIKLIEDFQAIVYRQVGKSKCNYFCAWEIVRKELVYTLQFIIEHGSDSLRWPKRI
ncbi:hypothetical protein SKAU_G00296520 [Synaphobranchus kaupii]|uniref:Uncharacterized protein n=1 Tax=Synaphobranchus kaupii TaxID=118154 RepID=A0A9Q1EUS1_SYNKA|nr:hypothetical protein SKAU_G00296520 [Synaphobranchus kaupii]